MPVIQIFVSEAEQDLLVRLSKGPISLFHEAYKASTEAKYLVEKGLAVYSPPTGTMLAGTLSLMKDS